LENDHVAVPTHLCKLVVEQFADESQLRAIAFVMDNRRSAKKIARAPG